MTELYRHFDANDRLLYVGISLSSVGRLSQHRSAAPWFEHIARITIERLPTRREAMLAEVKAIRSEGPIWNRAYARPGAARALGPRVVRSRTASLTPHLASMAKLGGGYAWRAGLETDFSTELEWISAADVMLLTGLELDQMAGLMSFNAFPQSTSMRGGKLTDRYRADEVAAWLEWRDSCSAL